LIPRPGFSPDERREIGKAVVIAGLSVVVTKLAEWGMDLVRGAVTPPPRAEERCPGCAPKP
jgi:hypothetical protein